MARNGADDLERERHAVVVHAVAEHPSTEGVRYRRVDEPAHHPLSEYVLVEGSLQLALLVQYRILQAYLVRQVILVVPDEEDRDECEENVVPRKKPAVVQGVPGVAVVECRI